MGIFTRIFFLNRITAIFRSKNKCTNAIRSDPLDQFGISSSWWCSPITDTFQIRWQVLPRPTDPTVSARKCRPVIPVAVGVGPPIIFVPPRPTAPRRRQGWVVRGPTCSEIGCRTCRVPGPAGLCPCRRYRRRWRHHQYRRTDPDRSDYPCIR